MTTEQKIYKKALKKCRPLREKKMNGTITYEEKAVLNRTEEYLWDLIQSFAAHVFNQMARRADLNREQRADLMMDLYLIWYEKLYDYDPEKGAPTTFFNHPFKQVVTKYLEKNIWHRNSYDAGNYMKVEAAKIALKRKGNYSPDPELLSSMTGMSPKVIKGAEYYGSNSARVDVDACIHLKSSIESPEEAFIQKEFNEVLYNALMKLSDLEREIILLSINGSGKSGKTSLESISETLDMPINQVKIIYNQGITKLAKNKEIKYRWYGMNSRERFAMNETNDPFQDDFLNGISNFSPGHTFAPDESEEDEDKEDKE